MPHTRAKWDQGASIIRCGGSLGGAHCGRPLAVWHAGRVVITHHGLEVSTEVVTPLNMKCWNCGGATRITPHSPMNCCDAANPEPVSA